MRFRNSGRRGSLQKNVCSMGSLPLRTPSFGAAPLAQTWDDFSKVLEGMNKLPGILKQEHERDHESAGTQRKSGRLLLASHGTANVL